MPVLTRRRSARLASNPKPAGSAAAPALDSLAEHNEHNETLEEPPTPRNGIPQTPSGSSPAKPTMSEMYPGKANNGHKATPSSALRLGFVDIDAPRIESPTTAKSIKIATAAAEAHGTPSKRRSPVSALSDFTFRFSRRKGGTPAKDDKAAEAAPGTTKKTASTFDLGLSEDARRLMETVRADAMKIRVDLEEERDRERAREEQELGRKFAKPKSRAGRYSDAHKAQFEKMDSIANHPSAFRMAKFTPVKSTAVPTSTTPTLAVSGQKRGLKRSQSKANLDDTTPNPLASKTPSFLSAPTPAPGASTPVTAKKQYNPLFGDSKVPQSAQSAQSARRGNILFPPVPTHDPLATAPAAKRLKQNVGDDASSSRPMSREGAASSLPRPASANTTATVTTAPGNFSSGSGLQRSNTSASIVTPTKAAIARPVGVVMPSGTADAQTPSKTPSRLGAGLPSALKKSVSTNNLHAAASRADPATATATLAAPTAPRTIAKPVAKSASKPVPHFARPIEPRKAAVPAPAAAPAMANSSAVRSTLPVASGHPVKVFASKTPAPPRVANKALHRFPATTPRRKVSKHVSFTPSTREAVMSQKSPSVFRSGIPRSALKSHQHFKADGNFTGSAPAHTDGSPSIRRRFGATVYYPDLTGHELLTGIDEEGAQDAMDAMEDDDEDDDDASMEERAPPTPSVPGTFTFRSDKTINFGEAPSTGFGSSPGQASIRPVRNSTLPLSKLPGSFPDAKDTGDSYTARVATAGSDKENERPVPIGIPHGITNKKRQRISEAEEEADEEAERAAKKRKSEKAPEGDALMAPRLAGKTMPPTPGPGATRATPRVMARPTPRKPGPPKASVPSAVPGAKTPGSVKKPFLSMSRLQFLATPKSRK